MSDYSSLPAIFLCLHPPPHPGRLSSLMLQTSSNTMLARSSLFLKKRPFQQGTILKCNRTHHCCSISPNSITERLSFNAHPLMALPIAILLASFLPGAAHTQQCSVSPHPLQLREGLPFHFLPFSDVGFSIMVLCSFPSLVTQCFCMYLAIDGSPFTTAVFLFLFFKELLCLF